MENQGEIFIGSGAITCSIVIMDQKVEDIHAVIKKQNGKFVIADYKSHYGSYQLMEKHETYQFQEGEDVLIEFELPQTAPLKMSK